MTNAQDARDAESIPDTSGIPNILDIFDILAGEDVSLDICDEWRLLAYIESTSMTWEQFLEMPPAAQDMIVPASIKHGIDSERPVWDVGWEEQYDAIDKISQDDRFIIQLALDYDKSAKEVLALFDTALRAWEQYVEKLAALLAEYAEAAAGAEEEEDDAAEGATGNGAESRTD